MSVQKAATVPISVRIVATGKACEATSLSLCHGSGYSWVGYVEWRWTKSLLPDELL